MIQTTPLDEERYGRAKRRVAELRGFYVHAFVFTVVNIGLAAYNLATAPGQLWFVYTLGGWGIGLIAHGAYIFGSGRVLGLAWHERKIREEMEHDRLRP